MWHDVDITPHTTYRDSSAGRVDHFRCSTTSKNPTMLRTLLNPSNVFPKSQSKSSHSRKHRTTSSVKAGQQHMDSPHSARLPPELIEAIIDEVGAQQDTPTLRSCSLVAFAFVFRAQTHLFNTIDLDRAQHSRKKYHDRFHRLLLKSPHLGTYVRHLRLGDDAEDEHGYASRDFDIGTGQRRSWITESKTLPYTISLLPRLRSFSLTFNSEWTNWESDIPVETRRAFENVFVLPSLCAVSLEFATGLPGDVLMGLVAKMEFLGLSCVEVGNAPLMMPKRGDARPKSLYLRGTSPAAIQVVAQALSATFAHNTLRKLSITPTFESGFGDAVAELMKDAGQNIEEFEWLPSIHFCSSVGTINISTLKYLRTLKFVVSFRKTHAHGPFPEVIRLLSQLYHARKIFRDHSDQLESITIECHCLRNMDAKALKAEWRPIDKVLSKPGIFERLKELKVILPTNTSSTKLIHGFIMAFQDALPLVQAKGVSISVRSKACRDERFFVDSFEELA